MTSEEKENALDEDCKRSSARVTYNKNMQIVDTNNYYPFVMNHLRDDAPSNFGQGSYKNYKYNGKADDIKQLRTKKEVGALSKKEQQKLKRHEKNTGERPSRQSKDKK